MNAQEIIELIVIAYPLIVTIASAIVAATPTPKDDILWGKIYKIIEVFALTVGKAKDKGPEK